MAAAGAAGGSIFEFSLRMTKFKPDQVPSDLSDDIYPDQWGAIARAINAEKEKVHDNICLNGCICLLCGCGMFYSLFSHYVRDHIVESRLRKHFFLINRELFHQKPVCTIQNVGDDSMIRINTQYIVQLQREHFMRRGGMGQQYPTDNHQNVLVVEAIAMPVNAEEAHRFVSSPEYSNDKMSIAKNYQQL